MKLKEITAEDLLKAAEDAIDRDELGLLVWESPEKWRYLNGRVTAGTEVHKKAMQYITNGQGVWLNLDQSGNLVEGEKDAYAKILVLPAENVAGSHNYRRRNASSLNFQKMEGPISMMPSVHVSSIYFNPKRG